MHGPFSIHRERPLFYKFKSMYYLYINTPLYENSNYVPHLIEHSVLSDRKNPKNYYRHEKKSWDTYTYYTSYTIDTNNKSEAWDFKKLIMQELDWSIIKYEKSVLKDETSYKNYYKRLINKIWKKVLWNNFKYSYSWNVSIEKIKKYHKDFYNDKWIILFWNHFKAQRINLKYQDIISSFNIYESWVREKIYIFNFNHENIFAIEILSQLFDSYIQYKQRYFHGKYYFDDVLSWEFENLVFISISQENTEIISDIEKTFIQEFINYTLEKYDESKFHSINWPLLLKYWFSISKESKINIINNIQAYYQIIQKNIEN